MSKIIELRPKPALTPEQAQRPRKERPKRLSFEEKMERNKRVALAHYGLAETDLPRQCPKCNSEPDWTVTDQGLGCAHCEEDLEWEEIVPLADRREALNLLRA